MKTVIMMLLMAMVISPPGADAQTRAANEVRQGAPYNPLDNTLKTPKTRIPDRTVSTMDGSTSVPRETSADAKLSARVKNELQAVMKDFDPKTHIISSNNGEVILQGVVKSQAQADEMQSRALRVNGVSAVNSKLVVETH